MTTGEATVLGAELLERWRDMGPTLWLVAAGAGAAWAILFAVLAAATDPRKVEPGPGTLDLGGDEPPAIVNLVTSDWDLGHEAVPATLLDLAARKHLAVEQRGDRTVVQLRRNERRNDRRNKKNDDRDGHSDRHGHDDLTAYERMVLDHVREHAAHAEDGAVPAQALTTGPDDDSARWWKRFRRHVHADARNRGLSRPRWSALHRAMLYAGAGFVGATIGLAASSMETEGTDSTDDPVALLIWPTIMTIAALVAVTNMVASERDTPAGRACAARWLGLRSMLAHDPIFQEQPPAGVAIWDRHLAHGAALGLAHGAVRELPLGAENENVAWSPVGGRWRVARIRYPWVWPPGWGLHPLAVAAIGLVHVIVVVGLTAGTATVAGELLVQREQSREQSNVPTIAAMGTTSTIVLQVALAVLAVLTAVAAARAVALLAAGGGDLVGGRRQVEGRVLRYRIRGGDDSKRWYVAVDDGTSDRIRAWRLRRAVHVPQGAWVGVDVAPRTGHVRDLEVRREPGGEPGSGPGTGAGADRGTHPATALDDLPMPRPQPRAEPH